MGEKEPPLSSFHSEEYTLIPEHERERLQRQLSEMYRRDQQARKVWDETGNYDPRPDQDNAQEFERIINEYGWPKKSQVGEEGMYAAWTVAEHLPVATQIEYLPLLEKAAKEGELEPSLFAVFLDRVAARTYGKQLFGSQYRRKKKQGEQTALEPYPLASDSEKEQIARGLLSPGWKEFLPNLREAYEQSQEEKQ